ncbi:HAD-IIIC family phosphatase [Thalassospira lucentensis]|uniref:HAD-IIIC family phosphatase n=1 Tax=Thalassospira lucentensis TaxID=168935 RepID=UPI003D2F246F
MILTDFPYTKDYRSLNNNPARYARLDKRLEELSGELMPLRIAILSSYTADGLRPFLRVELARRGLLATLSVMPFGQFEELILDPASLLYREDPDVVVILTRPEEMAADGTGQVQDDLLNANVARTRLWIENIRHFSDAQILVSSQSISTPSLWHISDVMDCHSGPELMVAQANRQLATICGTVSDCYLFDSDAVIKTTGLQEWSDEKMYYLGRIPHSTTAKIALSNALARHVSALRTLPKKCLVLDADNTLWGGVIGEDGLGGIRLGGAWPGNAFQNFQRYILRLREKGVILALCSKNNKEDVETVFSDHEDCLLKLEHFGAIRANWNDKASNITELAEELNIGVDSMVFVDDSPVECGWVRENLPQVTVVQLPSSPLAYIATVEAFEAFDILRLTQEDKHRANQYGEERQRKVARSEAKSLEDFLYSLEMKSQIEPVSPSSLARAVQLIHKTNQFNLTLHRHSEAELCSLMNNGAVALTLRLQDKFGDSGIVGLAIGVPNDDSFSQSRECRWHIDTFLLSCRVLGRGVEDLLLASLANYIEKRLAEDSPLILIGEFKSGKKNSQVADFYPNRDFEAVDGEKGFWVRNLSKAPLEIPAWFDLE